MRATVRIVLGSLLTGALMISTAWAGAVLLPMGGVGADAPRGPVDDGPLPLDLVGGSITGTGSGAAAQGEGSAGASSSRGTAPAADGRGLTAQPGAGGALAGSAWVDITPAPDESAGERWQTEGCATGFTNEHLLETRKTTTPDCLYMGGRGLGPSEPITAIDPDNPLAVRAVAVGDGEQTAVLVQVDGVYWFGQYETFCERCGAQDIIDDVAGELGIDPSGILIAANHSHNAPDFIGGWGGVPSWYMEQVGEAIRTALRDAVADLRPARLEAGEVVARDLNVERRSFYRSAEDATFTWFRALADQPGPPEVIATVGAFSAHPVTTGYRGGIAHADWPGAFDQRMRTQDGGLGIGFVAGLGNMLTRQGTWETADGLVALLAPVGEGRSVTDPDVRTASAVWDHPVTNAGVLALRAGWFFDRTLQGPAELRTGKSEQKPCATASAQSVRTSVSAVRIGDALVITGGPGELFANLSNTIKDQSIGAIALPLANVNDGVGYIMQAFETDHAGRQVLGFTDAPAEYEEAFSIDHCFGDMVTETTLALLREMRR